MSHYFTDNRQLPQNRKETSFRFSGFMLKFVTDNGVFSKNRVDLGTEVFLKTLSTQMLGDRVLDLGCGYGVIGITVKKMSPHSQVLMADVNPRAVELAVLNAQKNGVEAEARISDCFANIAETLSDILINPPIRAGKQVIFAMFEQALAHLEQGGHLMIVIRKQQGAESAWRKLRELFGNCEILEKEKGYWILKSTKGD